MISESYSVSTVLLSVATALSLLLAIYGARHRHHSLPYPPGPRRLPILGNLLDVPPSASWFAYTRWAKIYGDIISVEVFGQVIVVLNSVKTAKDLLDKRGNIYSDRPTVPFFDMMKWSWNIPAARYDNHWRMARKVLDRGMRPNAVAQYRTFQNEKVHRFLKALLSDPQNFREHINYMQGSIIMSLVYGYDVTGPDDRYLAVARHVSEVGAQTILPGAQLVNHLPSLKYLPEWLPGMGFKALARLGHDIGQELINKPFNLVTDAMVIGAARPSIALENLQDLDTSFDRVAVERAIRDACGSLYVAGADTTASALASFFLMLVLYPEVQARAQAELDSVIGRERLPRYEDRENLPYVNALCMELLRWRPVTPLAVPHAITDNDVYDGYFIPKGALVVANVWAMLHDPEAYPEPSAFKPERFLTADGAVRDDPAVTIAFGFGRRICPGRHLVDSTLFAVVSCVLSAFNVTRAKDAQGYEIMVDDLHTGDIISSPLPFQCSIAPRSREAVDVLSSL